MAHAGSDLTVSILFGMLTLALAAIFMVGDSDEPPKKPHRLPPPTLDHEPRLLALVERVEAEERRQKAGCGLEVCSVHDLREGMYQVRYPTFPIHGDGVDRVDS